MHFHTIVRGGWAVLCFIICASAYSAGPTSEDDAWGDIDFGRYPLELSADGLWRVHLDADNVLHRARLNGGAEERMTLPMPALALSASRDAGIVAFATRSTCVGIADFAALAELRALFNKTVSAQAWPFRAIDAAQRGSALLVQAFTAPPLRWLPTVPGHPDLYGGACPADADANAIGSETEPGLTDHPRIAISADGGRIALSGPSRWARIERISVIDAADGTLVRQLPSEGATLQLRFIDDDRALYAAQAILGAAYEGPAAPSDLRFAIWDLRSGELRNFVNRKPGGSFAREDFLADFSAHSRLVRMLQLDADRRDPENPVFKLRVRSANLGRCRTAFDEGWALPRAAWYGFVAAPNGAWVAAARDAQDDSNATPEPGRLVLFDAHTGRELHGFDLDTPLRSLAVAQDGHTLFATTRGQYRQKDGGGVEWVRPGGELRRFDVSEFGAASAHAGNGAENACPIEDEQRGAREVALNDTQWPTAYTRDLLTPYEESQAALRAHWTPVPAEPEPGRCGPNWAIEMRRTWGIADDGSIWLDRYRHLERIDPADGRRLAIVVTPRMTDRCAVVWYEQKQFIEAVDESVLLMPFEESDALPHRHLRSLANRPGWRAMSMEQRDSHLLVRWADKRYLGKTAEAPAGSAVGILYDLATGKALDEYPGRLLDERGYLLLDAEDDTIHDDVDLLAAHAAARNDIYDWQRGYFGSVRAVEHASAGRSGGTVLWAGLRVDEHGDADTVPDVQGLGTNLGAAIWPDRIEIYDAEKRQRIARLPIANARRISWHAPSRQLFIESSAKPEVIAVRLR